MANDTNTLKFLTDLDIRGTQVAVGVTPDGWFTAGPPITDKTVADRTLEGLRERLMRASKTKAVKVAIPAMRLHIRGGARLDFEPVTLTGIHAGNGQIIYRNSTGNAMYADAFNSGNVQTFYRVMTDDEQAEFRALYAAKLDAQAKMSTFYSTVMLSAGDVVKKAIEDAVAKGE